MGFKRTSDGRVFFDQHTGDQDNNKDKDSYALSPGADDMDPRPLTGTKPAGDSVDMQKQILLLLRGLNGKLQASQKDKEALEKELAKTRKLVEELQEQSQRSDQRTRDLEKNLRAQEQNSLQKYKSTQQIYDDTIKEFEETRQLIAEIEEQAQNAQKASQKQGEAIKQTEDALRAEVQTVKKTQDKSTKDILVRLDDQDRAQHNLDARLEDTAETTLKLQRKLDKAIQDRSRFIRKLERIEETVLKTNDALNARAMVLLTDQSVAAQTAHPQIPAALAASQDASQTAPSALFAEDSDDNERSWWQRSFRASGLAVLSFILLGAVFGWIISDLQKSDGLLRNLPDTLQDAWGAADGAVSSSLSSITPSALSRLTGWRANEEGPIGMNETGEEIYGNANENNEIALVRGARDITAQNLNSAEKNGASDDEIAALDQPVPLEEGAQLDGTAVNTAMPDANALSAPSAAPPEFIQDMDIIDIKNQDELLKLMEQDPGAAAKALNSIEPSNLSKSLITAKNTGSGISGGTNTSLVKMKNTQQGGNLAAPAIEPLKGVLRDRISPDPALPASFKEMEMAAFNGEKTAQHDLAALYVTGYEALKPDHNRAFLWFTEAAHQNVPNAAYNLGVLYHQGIGTPQDMNAAIQWYRHAAGLGHPEAQYNLAMAYIEGVGVAYDPQMAAQYFENATKGGVVEASYNLGLIYENGLLGDVQPAKALSWYKIAADGGNPEAQAALQQLADTLNVEPEEVEAAIAIAKVEQQDHSASVTTPQSFATTNIQNAVAGLDSEDNLILMVQNALMNMDLYPGPADGRNSMIVRDAVRSYQSMYNLPVTGEVTNALYNHMAERVDANVTEQASR